MIKKLFGLGSLSILAFNLFSIVGVAATDAKVRQIELFTQKGKDGAIHWMPEVVTVKAGETVEFVPKHEAPGGFDFHGLRIKALKIEKKIDRTTEKNPPVPFTVTIPKTLGPAPGRAAKEYPIDCQFHAGHKPAILKVEAAEEAPKG
jgi:plastocyanin